MWTTDASRLPDAYAKAPESANARLLGLGAAALGDAAADLAAVDGAGDLDTAFGRTLDYYGEIVAQPRGGLTDTQYRYMIRNKVARIFASGDYGSVMRDVMNIFNVQAGEVLLRDDETESGVVTVEKLPFSVITGAGITARQAVALLELLLPVGVRLGVANLEGTFAFAPAGNAGDYDEQAGFSNAADPAAQTVGGYLGFAIGEGEETPLPIT